MDIKHPHEIVYGVQPPVPPPAIERKWLPLTAAEAVMLEHMSGDERAAWLSRLPIDERLRRFAAAEQAEDVLRAAQRSST